VPDSVSAADQPGTHPSLRLWLKVANVTIPAGTRVRVRLVESLSTRRNQPGDKFTATLDRPIVQADKVVVRKGPRFMDT